MTGIRGVGSRQRRHVGGLVVAAVAAISMAAPAGAITNGVPDNGAHPNVGTVIWRGADGVLFRTCTGTLVSATVFLTAAHCLALDPNFPGEVPVGVSFDEQVPPVPVGYLPGTAFAHPDFVWSNGQGGGATGPHNNDAKDIGVVVLDAPVVGVTPARLPTLDQLDQMNAGGGLKGAKFVIVGYGATDAAKPGYAHCCGPRGERRVGTETFRALTNAVLRLNQNAATGNGGTCYGDSGGPHFIGTTDVIASITSTGDMPCVSNDSTYRVDTAVARAFLRGFVALP